MFATPERAADYWRQHVVQHPAFNPDVETFVVLLLNTRKRVKGHALVASGTLDTLLVHRAIYTRVSTDKQTHDSQLNELREYCARRSWSNVVEYADVISGAKFSRQGS